jgi:crotonyl-CoA carboxylase/reductase
MYERVVKEVMRRELVTCLVTTPIDQVMRRLLEFGVHALVVVDEDGYAVGIVSQTDVLLAYRARPSDEAAPACAGEIMSAALITCAPTATLLEAVTLMTRNHIHRLVVAKPDAGRVYPLGILSMTDIIRHLIDEPVNLAIPRLQVATLR